MQKFKDFLIEEHHNFLTEAMMLMEKLIVFRGKRQKYGRVIFLAGGAASGKGFAMKNFLDVSPVTDKIRDVDEWKTAFMTIAEKKKKYPELRGLDMRNPDDVSKLHMWVKEHNIKEKSLTLLLNDLQGKTLPNIVFDVTLKKRADIEDVIPQLLEVGYDPKDIHLVWVLTDVEVAMRNNLDPKRGRVVAKKILLQTHRGAAQTMGKILKGNIPKGLDGEIHVINNNRENTVFLYGPDGRSFGEKIKQGLLAKLGLGPKFEPNFVVKDFLSIKVKEAGKSIHTEKHIEDQLITWIRANAPRSIDIF